MLPLWGGTRDGYLHNPRTMTTASKLSTPNADSSQVCPPYLPRNDGGYHFIGETQRTAVQFSALKITFVRTAAKKAHQSNRFVYPTLKTLPRSDNAILSR